MGLGHKYGQNGAWGWAPPTCFPMQEARPWLQAIGLSIGHLQGGTLPLALLLIRAGLGRGQGGVLQAHAGQVRDLERELRSGRDSGSSGRKAGVTEWDKC